MAVLGPVEVEAGSPLVEEAGGALVDQGLPLYVQVDVKVTQDSPGDQRLSYRLYYQECQEVSECRRR